MLVNRMLNAVSVGLLSVLCLAPAYGQTALQDERTVKAAFVFNLIKYVEWPDEGKELVIGFTGDDSMGEMLKKLLDGKSSDNHEIRVLISPSDQDIQRCNLVYISEPTARKIKATLGRIHKKNILTVGETNSFTNEGGMVGLVRVGEQVHILVNLDLVQEANLQISSRLLNLSTVIRNGKEVR